MTEETFELEFEKIKTKIKLLEQQELKELTFKFANELPYKPGDVVRDHIGVAKIIGFYKVMVRSGKPFISFICENLTVKGEINKREPQREVFLSNIKSKV